MSMPICSLVLLLSWLPYDLPYLVLHMTARNKLPASRISDCVIVTSKLVVQSWKLQFTSELDAGT